MVFVFLGFVFRFLMSLIIINILNFTLPFLLLVLTVVPLSLTCGKLPPQGSDISFFFIFLI